MENEHSDQDLGKRRQYARVSLLKRRAAVASILGFAALFGLAAEHAVKSASTAPTASRSSSAATKSRTTFFDEQSANFSFDGGSSGPTFSAPQTQAPPPVAQTNVS